MTTIRDKSRKPHREGDDRMQPTKSRGEIGSGEDGSTQAQGQRGVTTPSQPGRKDRQDPSEEGGLDDQDQGDDEDLPEPDPQRTGRGESGRPGDITEWEAQDLLKHVQADRLRPEVTITHRLLLEQGC